MIGAVLRSVRWSLSKVDALALIIAFCLVYSYVAALYVWIGEMYITVRDFVSLRWILWDVGYKPGDKVWDTTTGFQNWFYAKAMTYDRTMPIELLGYLTALYIASKMIVHLGSWVKIAYYWIYVRLQFRVPLDAFAEKMMPGSNLEQNAVLPSFQAEVWVRNSGAYYKAGQGFMTKFGFVTAHHVVDEASDVKLIRGDQTLEVKSSRFKQLEGDVAICVLTKAEQTDMRMSVARLNDFEIPPKSGLVVQVQAYGSKTMGLLEQADSFGLCTYAGSTIKGFSGAPYYIGKQVFGMHIGGTSVNIGYEAAYLTMILRQTLENSEDYLLEQIRETASDFEWQRSPYDPDEARVKWRGKYFVVDMDTVSKLRGYGKAKQTSYHKPEYQEEALSDVESVGSVPMAPRGAMQYKDSKNLMSPLRGESAPVGELGTRAKAENVRQENSTNLPPVDLESPRHSGGSHSRGQPPIPAQRKDHSNSTPKSSSTSFYKQKYQRKLIELERLMQQLQATSLGE